MTDLTKAEATLEVAYQQFLVRFGFKPDPMVKAAFMCGYSTGFGASTDLWSARARKIVDGVGANL
jgi:hypothetical protein